MKALAAGLLVALCVPLAGSPRQPPQQQPTFKVEVNYVEVTARVLDASGKFVADLEQEDFEVLEEGRPQKIADFNLIDLTTTPTSGPGSAWSAAEPDVRTNAEPFDGRVFVLVLDSLHVLPERTHDVRLMARRFVEQYLADGDMAAVVNTAGTAEPAQEFTSSRARLLSAVDRFGTTVMRLETDEPTVRDMAAGGPTTLARDTLASLKALADRLGTVRGRRKAIVFFSEGPGYCAEEDSRREADAAPASGMAGQGTRFESLTPRSVDEPKSWARGVLNDAIQKLVAAANRGNVAIYGVDPRRLLASPADARGKSTAMNADGTSLSSCAIDASVQSLRDLSDQTSGFTIANTNKLDEGFGRLLQENSRYYVLGYYPAERGAEGAFRRIQVRVRRPGVQVQARQGYRVPPRTAPPAALPKEGQSSAALREAMDSVLPVSGLRVAATAVPFRGEQAGAELLVSVVVDGRDITFRQAEGQSAGGLEFALGTMNSHGERGANQYELVQLPLEEKSRAIVTGFGLRLVRKVAVAPGRHQLRVGVLDRPTGRAGVVHLDVLVPDYRKSSFDLSGILLTSSLAGRVPTARGGPLDQLQRQLPGPPALTREFTNGEDLAIYAELYGAVPGSTVLATVVDERGREVQRQGPPLAGAGEADLVAPSADRREVRRAISLRSLQPGRYLLRVEARSGTDKPETVRRELPFTIVP